MCLLILVCLIGITVACPDMEHYENLHITLTTISGFSEFKQLDFKSCKFEINITALRLKPSKRIILDNSLDSTGLKLALLDTFFIVALENIKGIDLRLNSFTKLAVQNHFDSKNIMWHFSLTKFDIFLNNMQIEKQNCSINIFDGSFMTKIRYLFLEKLITFSGETCPFLFHNSKMQLLKMDKISSSFTSKNVFAFLSLPLNKTKKINSHIIQFIISLYHHDLSTKLLDESVFKHLYALEINGQTTFIQDDLFKSFKDMRLLRIRTQNAKRILTQRNKWLIYLNYNLNIKDLNNQYDFAGNQEKIFLLNIYQTFSNITFYDYPAKDFCYFKNFPHNNLVLPQLKPAYKSKCSCTEMFLLKHAYHYDKLKLNYENFNDDITNIYYTGSYYVDEVNDEKYSYCFNSSFEQSLLKCEFKKRIQLCNILNISSANKQVSELSWYVVDWKELSTLMYISFVLYINPILSFISIIINATTIMLLLNKKLKQEIKCLYTYLNIHLIADILIVICNYLDLITECTYEDQFCSALRNSIYAEYFRIFFLKLMKNSLSTFSNISYTAFVLTRYIKISSSGEKFRIFNRIKMKYYLAITIIASLLVNLYICFEYSVRFNIFMNKIPSEEPLDNFEDYFSTNQKIILNVFQVLKIIFSEFVFCVVNIVLDAALITFIRRKTNKRIRAINLELPTTNKISSKERLKAMIILNSINFLLMRMPLAITDFYGLFISTSIESVIFQFLPNLNIFYVCKLFRFCVSLQKAFYSFYILSFFFQFLIFMKFDNNFSTSFRIIFNRESIPN